MNIAILSFFTAEVGGGGGGGGGTLGKYGERYAKP